jgi:toxin CptA
MSIAVSATVKPSRILLAAVCIMCSTILCIAVLVVLGKVGELSPTLRLATFIFTAFPALLGFYHTVRHQKIIHIDISGTGDLYLYQVGVSTSTCHEKKWPHVKGNGEVMTLLHDSTIWTNLLLLRLQSDGGTITVVRVLPDCVSRESFRALSVACRWIAAQNNSAKRRAA